VIDSSPDDVQPVFEVITERSNRPINGQRSHETPPLSRFRASRRGCAETFGRYRLYRQSRTGAQLIV
jgi:hypothetical protein